MLTLSFVRNNLLYCILAIGGLCLLVSGNLLSILGIQDIFRDPDDWRSADFPWSIVHTRAFAAQFYAGIFLTCAFVSFLARSQHGLNVASAGDGRLRRIGGQTLAYLPFPLIVLASATILADDWSWPQSTDRLIAASAGLVAALLPLPLWLYLLDTYATDPPHERGATQRALVLIFLAMLAVCAGFTLNPLTPSDAFFTLFGWITLAYLVVSHMPAMITGLCAVFLVFVAVAAAIFPGEPGKGRYQLYGLRDARGQSYYVDKKRVLLPELDPSAWHAAECKSAECSRKTAAALLATWSERRRLAKPKIVIVAASGGAYRATFWTTAMLDHLAHLSRPKSALEGFTDHIRLVTGASGGMIGVAYFAVCGTDGAERRLTRVIESDVKDPDGDGHCRPLEFNDKGPIDSLLPVLDHLGRRDLIDPLIFRQGYDRGAVLERQWRSIDITFKQMARLQEDELRPAIIFTPTIAERGTPLEVSNLFWSESRDGAGAFDLHLFNAFPDAVESLTLATAARLSASFPLITPAAALPTRPSTLHLVDAGYFDNEGIDAAANYLRDADVLDWLQQQSSGVILVALRAFPSPSHGAVQDTATSADDEHCFEPAVVAQHEVAPSATERLFQWARSQLPSLPIPLRAAANVREAGARHRADVTTEYIRALLSVRGIPFDFVAFENASRVNMSWYLKRSELDCLNQAVSDRYNTEQIQKLSAIWAGYLSDTQDAPRPPGNN